MTGRCISFACKGWRAHAALVEEGHCSIRSGGSKACKLPLERLLRLVSHNADN